MFGSISAGGGLLLIAFTAQWVLKKRLTDKTLRVPYMWIAWICALAGGLSVSENFGQQLGITGLGASIVSGAGLLLLVADLKDKRPDWPAFFIAALLPMFMQLAGGPFGKLLQGLLVPFKALSASLGAGIGG